MKFLHSRQIHFALQSEVMYFRFMQLDTTKWITFFQRNQTNRPEPHWDAPISISGRSRGLLVQSLREFQLGDGGGPAALIAKDTNEWKASQLGLEQVVDLWFEEEKGHSRLLGGLLKRFNVEPISGHWSFSLFCGLRRQLGVRFELQILTLTELSSTAYYRLLRTHGPDSCLKEVCALILRDESGHVAFQNDRCFASMAQWSALRFYLWRRQFWLCGFFAATVLWLSHGKALRSMGATTREFYAEVRRQFARFIVRLKLRRRKMKNGPSQP